MASEFSSIVSMPFGVDRSTNLITATPVDLPILGLPYHKAFSAVQSGAIVGIMARCETTPSAVKLVVQATIGGVEQPGKVVDEVTIAPLVEIATGETEAYERFDKEICPFAEGDEVGVSICQTGTIDDAIDEVVVILLVQWGLSEL